MRFFFFFGGAGALVALLYLGFLEFYYYRDRVDWLYPLSTQSEFLVRRDRWGKGDFGAKRSGGRRHHGVDILADEGVRVVAVRAGRARVGEVPKGMGKFISITHREGIRTIYGHLSETFIRDKSRVRQGQLIGAVGKTGNASAEGVLPHLHFEMKLGDAVIDPTPILNRTKPKPL